MAERLEEGIPEIHTFLFEQRILGSGEKGIMQVEFGGRLIPYVALLGEKYNRFYPGPYLGQEIRVKGSWGGIATVVGLRLSDQDERRIVQVLPNSLYGVEPFWVRTHDIAKDDEWPTITGDPKTMGLQALEFSVEAVYLPANRSRERDRWEGIKHILAIKLSQAKGERIITLGQPIAITKENKLSGEITSYKGLVTRLEMNLTEPSISYTPDFILTHTYARADITYMDHDFRTRSRIDLFSISIL